MGCDIHGVWQKKVDGRWVDIPSEYDQDRHYQLFAVLADVRNGRGFAGCVTGAVVEPISMPRGLPDDFVVNDDEHPIDSVEILTPSRQKYYRDFGPMFIGDHSHSWLTGHEMLDWYSVPQETVQCGIIPRSAYETWDRSKGCPDSYCGGISGPNVVLIDEKMNADKINSSDWTYIRCYWKQNLNEELRYFFDEVKRLVTEHGEIRFVFGFDS